MNTLAVLPIKSFTEAKQRLADELAAGPRRALAEAMFSDVVTALRRSQAVDAMLIVSSDHTAQRIAGGHGADVLEDRGEGHSQAATLGVNYAVERGAKRVLLVPGDCPLLDPRELDELLGRPAGDQSALIVPDRHGTGTNALLLTPPTSLTPAFGPDSCARHQRLAAEQGTAADVVHVPTLALDVDTAEDLAALRQTLETTRGGSAHTRGMLNQLQRSRA
ncbi:MAG TPA: 2-phospho-L-lactate guanylyltransferase [Solirubrobacteraceae bacterium]|jgi:2-phospho-L-lactate guanylyltransferase|nr:2-phospho-L-lactate guanylyltransferase [Solirubrobacteraceae bacterium]